MVSGKILVVDDQPDNIGVLFNFLRNRKFEVFVANDGESALEAVREEPPDLILLDVMMPGISGFEVCRRLKTDPASTDIPVIFMTALTDTPNKLEGFASGGVDYITKPFHQEEVLARINTHLTIHHLQNHLQTKNAELEAFAHTVAHDLKNPLSAIFNAADILVLDTENQVNEEDRGHMETIRQMAAKASDIVESLLLLAGTSRHRLLVIEPFSMKYVMPKVKERLAFMLKEYNAELVEPQDWAFACGFPAWVEEVWVNYISNALKYGGRPPRVELDAVEEGDFIRFRVRDNGPGLTREEQAKLFTPFIRLHTDRAEGHGLGLSIVYSIVTKLGGRVGVESAPQQGSVFYFTLPRNPPLPADEGA